MSKSSISIEPQAIPGFYVAGPSIVTSQDKAADDINALWQRFLEDDLLHKISPRADNVLYAVYSDYEGDHTEPYRVTLGCKLGETPADLPLGLHKVHVPSGDYAIFAASGEQPKALVDTWQNIWKMEIPRSYTADLEIYGPRFFEAGVHEVLVCIGLKRQEAAA